MKYLSLVPPCLCKTPAIVSVHSEGIDEDGAPIENAVYTGFCNYQSKSGRVYRDKETYVAVTGKCMFNGDIFPALPEIPSGTVLLFGVEREIVNARKARNPDGTVNYTEIDIS